MLKFVFSNPLFLIVALPLILSTSALSQTESSKTETSKEAAQDTRQIVAEVNGESISKEQLDAELRSSLREEVDKFKDEEKHVLLRTMLEKMVERLLLLQEARVMKLIPGDAELEKFIVSINAQLPKKDQFEHQLKKFGVDENDYRERLRQELGIKEYLDRKVFKFLAVSPQEIEKEFNDNLSLYKEPLQVCARHIFIKVPKSAAEEVVSEIEKRAQSVRKMLDTKDSDFATIARRFSEANNRGRGGNLGCFTKNQLPKAFAESAFKLSEGEMSNIVRTSEGFHIIKADKFKGGKTPELEEVKTRIENKLLRSKRAELLKEHLEKLKKDGKVILYYN
jgi:parvulin-like peptidyl-prolyl isomerase